jgi:hypothetical protein
MISRRYFLKTASVLAGSTVMPSRLAQSSISERANASAYSEGLHMDFGFMTLFDYV